jgi:phage tail sheath protein FI
MAALVDTRMPGVYTVEVPTLPPSIALVPSAVPCFIGYTEKHEKNGESLLRKPTRVRSMREYEDWFGGASNAQIKVSVVDNTGIGGVLTVKAISENFKNRMHYAMQLYYANGGGPCFIYSIGTYTFDRTTEVYDETLFSGLKKAKDITILVMPDATDSDKYSNAVQEALKHCSKAINRVALLDVKNSESEIEGFRNIVPVQIDQKKYGAAYFPFLNTTLVFKYEMDNVVIGSFVRNNQVMNAADATASANAAADYQTKKAAQAKAESDQVVYSSIKNAVGKAHAADNAIAIADLQEVAKSEAKRITGSATLDASLSAATVTDFATLDAAIGTLVTNLDVQGKTDAANAALAAAAVIAKSGDLQGMTLDILEGANNELASKIKQAIRDLPVLMPPTSAIAGIMVQTDANQGVWQAPANVGVAATIAPAIEIDDDLHASLNVDATSGKSINAIRSYEGRGVLVFGARTLAGNDLEWRYISVRRTFCFIEDAIGRAMQNFVFSPNTRDTWIKVKAMIDNFLVQIWQAGGLFGNTTNEAFQVNVGLPETMTDVDILEGKMIVEIKLRVARPAEFIILRYEHKFQANAN